jgi:site-specific recombinase XerC
MLTLPSPTFDYSALDRAKLADGTRKHYKAAITLLLASKVNPMDYDELIGYASSLKSSSARSNLKAAYAIITKDYVNRAKISNAPVETIQRFLWLMEALNDSLTVSQPDAERTPHWLSQQQVDTITSLALTHSQRDYIILAVLLGAGLRREELETLTFDALSQIPSRNIMRDVLTIRGKGDKKRIVPISSLLASHLRTWKETVHGGRIARKMNKGGKIGETISAFGIFSIVRKYGQMIGITDLDPHDLRRSYGRLMYEATHDIVLVKDYLGHSDTKTTLKYIGYDLKLDLPDEAFPIRASEFVMMVAGD